MQKLYLAALALIAASVFALSAESPVHAIGRHPVPLVTAVVPAIADCATVTSANVSTAFLFDSSLHHLVSKLKCAAQQKIAFLGELACHYFPELLPQHCTPEPPPLPDQTQDVIADKTNDVSGSTSGNFNWMITLQNIGTESAVFVGSGVVVLRDELPVGPTYSNVTVTYGPTSSGSLSCAISSDVLTCTVVGTVFSLGGGGGFATIEFLVETADPGILVNPRSGGTCAVDPDGALSEIDENNNDCSDSVEVIDNG